MENANRLRSMYTEKKLGGTGTLRLYRSTVAAMQYFNKDSDEEVLNGMRTLMNKPEKAPPETKKKMARELEKLFKGIMQFDNNKCEFSSYEELWTDPKHKDLAIMAGIASECETLLTQYETLMRDPASNCALDEEMYKEVKSKISLLEVAAPVCVSNKIVSSIYDSTGMADFDINNLIKRDAESVSDMYEKLHDGAFILLGSLVEISGKAIKPNEKFLNAVNKEREMLDLHPFPDEAEMNDRYKEIINKIDRAVAIDNGLIKEESEKKNNQPESEAQNVINEEPVAERSSEISNQNKINLDEPEEDGYVFERSSVISSISGQNRINLDKPEEDDEPEVEEKKDSAKAEEKKEEAKDGIANEIKEPVQAEPEVKPEVPVQAEEKQEAPVQAVPEIDNVSEIDLNVLDDEELMAEEEELVAELDEIVRNEIEFDDDVEAVRKAPTKEEITKEVNDKLAAFEKNRNVNGFVDYMTKVREEYKEKDVTEEEDIERRSRQEAVSEYLCKVGERGSSEQLTKDDRKFYLDVYDENTRRRYNAMVEVGKKIEQVKENILAGDLNDVELLKDNPKIVDAMAHEIGTNTESGKDMAMYMVYTDNSQDMSVPFAKIVFDQEELNYHVEGYVRQTDNTIAVMAAQDLIAKHNWKICQEVFSSRPDVTPEKLGQYNNAVNDFERKAKSKYNIGLEIKDGKPQIASLPDDIVKIKQSDDKELQAYRDKTKSELGVLNVAKDAVEPVAGWATRMVHALDEVHPYTGHESKEYKNMRSAIKTLTNIDSGSGLISIKNSLGKMIETASAFEKENSGLFSDSTLTAYAQKMRSFAECKLPEFNGLLEKIENPTFISGSIDQRIETLRRIDKEAELRGITLDKKDELTFAPETDRGRIETVGNMLENAKKGVMFGSKEYDNAAKSYAEMAKAYKSFRDMGGNATDEQRMNAIEAYQEAANKARADIEKYMKYRQAKGAMENNQDVKTQRRIDAMTAALNAVCDTNAYMDDRYTEVSKKILKAENAKNYMEENEKITKFRMDMEKDPSFMKHIVKGANEAMDKLEELSSGKNDVPLTPEELKDAKKAMATITLYTRIQHGLKNGKGAKIPDKEDLLEPMTNMILNETAFQKATEDINTREQLRNVMVDPDALRAKYTVAKYAEMQQQKKNAERKSVRNEPLINNEVDRQSLNNGQQNNNLNRNNNRNKGLK